MNCMWSLLTIDLTSATSTEEPLGSILLEHFSPKPRAEMPGRPYLIGCKWSKGWKIISDPRDGSGRAW